MAATTNTEKECDLALLWKTWECNFAEKYQGTNKKINCWTAIGEKFDLSPDQSETKFKNTRTATGDF